VRDSGFSKIPPKGNERSESGQPEAQRLEASETHRLEGDATYKLTRYLHDGITVRQSKLPLR